MPFDRAVFFDQLRGRPFDGHLTAEQVDGIDRILDEWTRRELSDIRWLAYMLATVFKETGRRMKPVTETGSEQYLRSKAYYPWIGEGLIQVTWEHNARKFGATKPGDLLAWPTALKALFDGMIQGVFTGQRLADFFNRTNNDAYHARTIVNGLDCANEIAGYYLAFKAALVAADHPAIATTPVSAIVTPTAVAAPAPAAGWLSRLWSAIAPKRA